MSHSHKKHPAGGVVNDASDKEAKRLANRAERLAVHMALAAGQEVLPDRRQVSDHEDFPKKGREWLGSENAAALRK